MTGYVYVDDQNPSAWFPGVPESALSGGERAVRLDGEGAAGAEESLLAAPYVWLRVTEMRRRAGGDHHVFGEGSEMWLPASGGLLNGGRWLHAA